MGSPTTLVLECRRPSAAYTATTSTTNSGCRSSNFTYDQHNIDDDDQGKQIHRIEEYLNALEEERRKIEVFKRELPLCMQLLQDGNELVCLNLKNQSDLNAYFLVGYLVVYMRILLA